MDYTKVELLQYFRKNSEDTFRKEYSIKTTNQSKTKQMDKNMDKLKAEIIEQIEKRYMKRNERVEKIFLATYCWTVVSLERRNALWAYNSMDLSRRSGELWERLIKVSWKYPVNEEISIFKAPSFVDVMSKIKISYRNKLDRMSLSDIEKKWIYTEYTKIWDLLGKGINLDSDQLFENSNEKFIIDFKGSYGSNEKRE